MGLRKCCIRFRAAWLDPAILNAEERNRVGGCPIGVTLPPLETYFPRETCLRCKEIRSAACFLRLVTLAEN